MVRLGGERAAAPSGPAHHPALCPQVARGRDKAQGGGEPRGERQARGVARRPQRWGSSRGDAGGTRERAAWPTQRRPFCRARPLGSSAGGGGLAGHGCPAAPLLGLVLRPGQRGQQCRRRGELTRVPQKGHPLVSRPPIGWPIAQVEVSLYGAPQTMSQSRCREWCMVANNKVPTMYLYIFETHASCHTMMAFKYPSAHYSLSPLL